MNKQSKNGIGWCDWTWNPIKGLCPMECWYCYARRIYKRFKWNPHIRLDKKELVASLKLKKPSKIFIGSTIEMYHDNIPHEWLEQIFEITKKTPQHTYITLTKLPHKLSNIGFPENWWVGVSVDVTQEGLWQDLRNNNYGNIKFISFEPLLSYPNVDLEFINIFAPNWIIVGGLTPKSKHEKEWIDDIVRVADNRGIPIFIKNNAKYPTTRKEFPQ